MNFYFQALKTCLEINHNGKPVEIASMVSSIFSILFQVTVQYEMDGGAVIPVRVHTVVISVQHTPDVTPEQMDKDLREHIIKVFHH